jgi:hypothetical protein
MAHCIGQILLALRPGQHGQGPRPHRTRQPQTPMDHPNTFFSAKSSICVIVRAMRCEIDPNQRLERANGVARTEPH